MKFFGSNIFITIKLLAISVVLAACVPNISNNLRTRSSTAINISSVTVGQGLILADNPIILGNNANLSPSFDLNKFTTLAPITNGAFLTGGSNCYGLNYCFEVRAVTNDSTALQTTDGKWGFLTTDQQFLEVNTYYHMNKIFNQFYSDLYNSYNLAYNVGAANYDTSLPYSQMKTDTSFQFFNTLPLIAHADCDSLNNSFFDRTTNSLCFGYIQNNPGMKWAQDSTVIYHETGHYFQRALLNLRNYGLAFNSDMGNYHYDEAGSIGEGLSDYFSYYINQRPHFAEWAAGRVLNASRPMTEDDSLHVSSLSKTPDGRLRYPDYIDYDPNNHTIPVEDIHLSGMVMSHFLVALTEDLMDKCSFSKRDAQTQVIHVIEETLAELGDLTTKGTTIKGGTIDSAAGRINLNATYAHDWVMKVNPINFRSFTQTLAKYVKLNLGNPSLNRCNNSIYTQDQLETLIDDYGLLLFRTYNENRNISKPNVVNNTLVTATNRNKTVLISKDLVQFDPTTNAPQAFVIDNRSNILSGIQALQTSGLIADLSTQTPTDLGFNNGNGKVSPGEVVAIGLNLYNNSNSVMGGVQILANNWKTLAPDPNDSGILKPCIYPSSMSNDSTWTTTTEGGIPCDNTTVTGSEVTASDLQPICVMQYNGANSTTWVSQHTFRNKISVDSSYCLNNTDDRDCFIRAIKGADQAYYSKLNPKSNWYQTMQDPNSQTPYVMDWGNIILFEVSKHIPPGTVVDCRFRIRYTNCDDCYHDASRNNYDYTDRDYNGPKPFKILHLKMTIVD